MTNYQISAGGLYVPPSAADGAYLAHKAGTRFTEFLHFVNGANTTVTLGAGTVQIDAVSGPLTLPLTTVIGGVPDFVWDADNQLVTTESA